MVVVWTSTPQCRPTALSRPTLVPEGLEILLIRHCHMLYQSLWNPLLIPSVTVESSGRSGWAAADSKRDDSIEENG
jgi:hypothetical protein